MNWSLRSQIYATVSSLFLPLNDMISYFIVKWPRQIFCKTWKRTVDTAELSAMLFGVL